MRRLIPALSAPMLIFVLSFSGCAKTFEPPVSQLRSELDIQRVLDAQVSAWNRGDLVAFMTGYWNSPELTFVSGSTRIRGWEATLARYRRRYAAPGTEMGQLGFHDLEIDVFSPEAAFVRGRYQLDLSDGTANSGRFTLILRKLEGEWRIVYDHTSS